MGIFMTLSRQDFRKQIRNQRNQLSNEAQYQASIDIVTQFSTLTELASAQNIALYLSADGFLVAHHQQWITKMRMLHVIVVL